jgi:hypothetical protein
MPIVKASWFASNTDPMSLSVDTVIELPEVVTANSPTA